MKATGIVRRIDELGRVVVPKEIRRTLRIREGDPLEIFTDRNGEIILKKYSPMGELGAFAKEYVEALNKSLGHIAMICDRDSVIATAGVQKKEYLDQSAVRWNRPWSKENLFLPTGEAEESPCQLPSRITPARPSPRSLYL